MVKKYISAPVNMALALEKAQRRLVEEDVRRVAACELLWESGKARHQVWMASPKCTQWAQVAGRGVKCAQSACSCGLGSAPCGPPRSPSISCRRIARKQAQHSQWNQFMFSKQVVDQQPFILLPHSVSHLIGKTSFVFLKCSRPWEYKLRTS